MEKTESEGQFEIVVLLVADGHPLVGEVHKALKHVTFKPFGGLVSKFHPVLENSYREVIARHAC